MSFSLFSGAFDLTEFAPRFMQATGQIVRCYTAVVPHYSVVLACGPSIEHKNSLIGDDVCLRSTAAKCSRAGDWGPVGPVRAARCERRAGKSTMPTGPEGHPATVPQTKMVS